MRKRRFTESVRITEAQRDRNIILNAVEMDIDRIFRNNGIECDESANLVKNKRNTILGKYSSTVKPLSESVKKSIEQIEKKYEVKVTYDDTKNEFTINGWY